MTVSTVRPKFFGPALSQVRFIVIHSVESEMKKIMVSLATGWWQNPSNKSSVHGGADPYDFVYMAEEDQRAWHAGNVNSVSLGYEHSGRAAFTKEQWLTPDSVQMLRNSCRELAKVAKRHGIPSRWLSLEQIRDGSSQGFITHNDARLVFGGTTHTDPGPHFPYALFMQLLQQYSGAPVDPGPAPITPPPGPGGAEGDDMYDTNARNEIVERLDRGLTIDAATKAKVDKLEVLIGDPSTGLQSKMDALRADVKALLVALAK